MARNRKTQSAGVRFGPALKALLLCLLLGGSGVGYVWQKDQIVRLGKQIKARETGLSALQEQNENLRKQLERMRSFQFLEAKIKELNLGLVPPPQSQIWQLPEPGGEPRTPESQRERQFAAQETQAPR